MSTRTGATAATKRPLEDATNKLAKKTVMKPSVPTRAAAAARAPAGPTKEQQLQEELDESHRIVTEERDSNQKLRGQIVSAIEKIDAATKRATTAETKLAECEAMLTQLKDENQVVVADLNEQISAEAQRCKVSTEALELRIGESETMLKDTIAAHKKEMDDTKAGYEKLIRESTLEYEKKIAHLEAKMEEMCAAHAREISGKESVLSENSMKNVDLANKIAALTAQCAAKEDMINSLRGNLQGATMDMSSLQGALSCKEREMAEMLAKGERERRKLLNQIEELRGNIRVYCRVRPTFDPNTAVAQIDFPDALDHREIVVRQTRENATSTGKSEKPQNFKYDYVFGPDTTQSEVFDQVSPLVESVLDGYKVCVFAYGQTGSGKTHTMEGRDGELQGIIPRSIVRLFESAQSLAAEHKWNFTVSCTYIEIYNDVIRDLLADSDEYHRAVCDGGDVKHEIRHEGKQDTYVTGVRSVVVQESYQVQELLRTAAKNRSTARTKLNERSSRSHSVFTLKFEGVNPLLGQKTLGVLCLIDLAGSERVVESGAIGNASRMKEAVSINQSLSHLGNVISALGESNAKDGTNSAGHIPFRNCKLTYLLQNYLGGEGSKTLMFVNVSPQEDHVSETANSLRFAAKVNNTVIGTAKKRIVQA
eukprot:PhM_4_TR12643/c0_g1_i1/m.58534/K10405/KIFC1; kinesin family member C1